MWNFKSEKKCILFLDHWVKCDDDNISVVKNEDVLKLSGGGE